MTTTQGSTGFVSDSVNYIDVGLKLDVEPTVYVDDDVGIRISLEVSTLGNQIKTASGTIAYQIGTRNASTLLRLHDGETQLLAGLISTQDSSTANKVPGLGDLPVAGRLFSSQLDNGSRVDLVLSVTPHIIRNVRRPDASESEMWVGTEALPRLRPAGGVVASLDSSAAAQPPGAAAPDSGRGPSPALLSNMDPSPPTPAAVSAVARLNGPLQVKAGDVFSVALELQSEQTFRGVPAQFAYAKDRLELLGVEEGEFFRQGNAQTSFTKTIDAANGLVSAGVLRTTASGAGGKGEVFALRFKARSAGAADVRVLSLQPVGLAGPVPPLTVLPTLHMQVQ